MRKWLFVIGLVLIVYLFSMVNSKKAKEKSPFSQRFNESITVLVWALTIFYVIFFLYYLYTVIFK
jgi:hypothetical protein